MQKAVVTLRLLEEQAGQDVARALGISTSHVAVLLHRAKTTLRSGVRLNVYAEMGSAWSNVMTDATQAQHYIGKLVKYLGVDNIVWGTDCILGGSPQSQIQAFRDFQMTDQFAELYGYRKLTDEDKNKIFGLNAAKLYRIDPAAARCQADQTTFAALKRQMDEELGPNRWALQHPLGPRTRREFLGMVKGNQARGVPG